MVSLCILRRRYNSHLTERNLAADFFEEAVSMFWEIEMYIGIMFAFSAMLNATSVLASNEQAARSVQVGKAVASSRA